MGKDASRPELGSRQRGHYGSASEVGSQTEAAKHWAKHRHRLDLEQSHRWWHCNVRDSGVEAKA